MSTRSFRRQCISSASATLLLATAAAIFMGSCDSDGLTPPSTGFIAAGTWGGENSGMIVSDSSTHVHIGCTYGDIVGDIPIDDDGRFDIEGSYLLRAFPVAMGPTMPAQFTGTVRGAKLTLIVAVNDTIEQRLHILGPVNVQFGKDAKMGPCPICRKPVAR